MVERRIQSIKKALSGMLMAAEDNNWVKLVDSVISTTNDAPTDALHGKAPSGVAGDENVIFDVQQAQSAKAEQNVEKFEKQAEKVQGTGVVRTLVKDSHKKVRWDLCAARSYPRSEARRSKSRL